MERGIYTIKRISLDKVSCFLIYSEGKALLVDSGNSGSEKKILESMGLAGVKPEMLKLLVLTHAHFDHAGSAKRIK
ncbi:MAG: MBL fold metallo-hydrolase, partial [Bacteroidetes bacterium]